jgi:hypothetical protein
MFRGASRPSFATSLLRHGGQYRAWGVTRAAQAGASAGVSQGDRKCAQHPIGPVGAATSADIDNAPERVGAWLEPSVSEDRLVVGDHEARVGEDLTALTLQSGKNWTSLAPITMAWSGDSAPAGTLSR